MQKNSPWNATRQLSPGVGGDYNSAPYQSALFVSSAGLGSGTLQDRESTHASFFPFCPLCWPPRFSAPFWPFFPLQRVLCSVEQGAQHRAQRGATSGPLHKVREEKFLPEICAKKGQFCQQFTYGVVSEGVFAQRLRKFCGKFAQISTKQNK